jgi:two-component system KDP operon response regulator KdpE
MVGPPVVGEDRISMSEARLLVVDDDPKIRRLLQSQLTLRGYIVESVGSGPEALDAIGLYPPHLVLLDLSLPGMNGIAVCKNLREWSEVPVILLTANDAVDSKIAALDAGADDYLTKPFHMGELIARIRTVLRRTPADTITIPVFKFGDIEIDMAQRQVRREEQPIHLTRIEFDLLSELARYADRVLTYDHLLQAVWGPTAEDIHGVHVHISNLRRKLEKGPGGPRHILAVAGVGYRLRT